MSKKKLLYVAPHLSTGGQPQYLYKQVKEFIKDSPLKDSHIIPVSAHHNRNIDFLIEAIEELFPTPPKDLKNVVWLVVFIQKIVVTKNINMLFNLLSMINLK